jgi:hypothetical protein
MRRSGADLWRNTIIPTNPSFGNEWSPTAKTEILVQKQARFEKNLQACENAINSRSATVQRPFNNRSKIVPNWN